MNPKEQVILNYGLMLNGIGMELQDKLPIISHTIQSNNLNQDSDLIMIVGLFEEFLLALKRLDDELTLLNKRRMKNVLCNDDR